MSSNVSLQDLLRGFKTVKSIVDEVKDIAPDIKEFIDPLIGGNLSKVNAEEIKKAIDFASNRILNSPWVILGVSKNDPVELIDAIYKLKVKYFHPDNPKTGDSEKFIKLKEAYDKIKNSY